MTTAAVRRWRFARMAVQLLHAAIALAITLLMVFLLMHAHHRPAPAHTTTHSPTAARPATVRPYGN